MKERILNALRNSENTNCLNTSVIFENRNSGKLTFYNALTNQFEFISKVVFEELKAEKLIKAENCICQGDTRFIIA